MPVFPKLFKEYTDLLCKEIELFDSDHPGVLRTAETLYLGGGTPSSLPHDCLRQIFSCLASFGVDVSRMKEVSMEFNPESTNEASINNAIQLGVSRISLGLQTFNGDLLKLVGRSHSVEMGLHALEMLVSHADLQVSGDLMFNLPTQTAEGFLEDVDRLSDYPLNHISFYGLTVSPRTRLGHRVAKGEVVIDEDLYESMYMGGVELLDRKGFKRYEVSNFARPGYESIHNRNYWNRGEYVGFGPGAHSFMGDTRFFAPEMYPRWREYVRNGADSSMLNIDKLDDDDVVSELIWLSLRQRQGINLCEMEKQGIVFQENDFAKWLDKGFLVKECVDSSGVREDFLRLEGRGWIFMDDIATDLMNDYSKVE